MSVSGKRGKEEEGVIITLWEIPIKIDIDHGGSKSAEWCVWRKQTRSACPKKREELEDYILSVSFTLRAFSMIKADVKVIHGGHMNRFDRNT